ncbi:unnamed protein product [Rotaria sordida]|uniref:Cupin 2 conserved barrel domain-containing protein n=1 Tax=Rotaria sordida TaxID=392033 RepID=A0A815D1B1_9BILA|nr:unnamed protein product [Rotaria sordida]CAF3902140.1 unnamed protein product [Rotaria sordida]
MLTDIIIVIIFNVFCNIQFTSQISLQSTHNNQSITSISTVDNQYRGPAVHTIITDNHIAKKLNKLDSRTIGFTTETSTSNNQSSFIPPFQTKRLPINPDVVAPDGSLVRNLLTTIGGSMAQFSLPPGMTSNAVEHRTVSEIWYFLSGHGEFWRKQNDREEIVTVGANVCITIPVGTQFQFRTIGRRTLVAVAITMPPWPGGNEAMLRQGIWNPSVVGTGH